MITVGLVKELLFIAQVFRRSFNIDLKIQGAPKPLQIFVSPDAQLKVWYNNEQIWEETIEGDTSFFGVESCDTISRIVFCIDNGSPWKQYAWKESLDKRTSSG